MKILLFILTFNQIIEQTKIISQDKTAFNQAIIMERSGEVSDAKLIYKKILEQNPSHQKSYLQLRNIYMSYKIKKGGASILSTVYKKLTRKKKDFGGEPSMANRLSRNEMRKFNKLEKLLEESYPKDYVF